MRPAGGVRQALMQAAAAYPNGATLRELAGKACVGLLSARRTVDNMHRAGLLVPVGERAVAYRNRPVAVYKPASADAPTPHNAANAVATLCAALSNWAGGQQVA